MELEIYQVDSFSTESFKGNPAGVCITETGLSENLMLSIAKEMAVSETAFLSLDDMNLRWFSPKVEVALCGHGTLAVAHVLKEKNLIATDENIVFDTLSGPLSATARQDNIEMDFPAAAINFDVEVNNELIDLLGISPKNIIAVGEFETKTLIEVDSEQIILDLQPNFDGLKQIPGRSVVVTAKSSDNKVDFISRNFAPWVGVNEDPVTGSAHCALAVHWGDKLGKKELKGYQASERGGFVDVEILPNNRIKIIGNAVTVLKGTLYV